MQTQSGLETKHKSRNVLTYFEHGLLEITKYQASRQENHAVPKVKIYWTSPKTIN